MSDDEFDDDVVISLNMDDPFNRQMMDFVQTAPPRVVDAFMARMHRRGVFDQSMESIGSLTRYRRKMVVRALVKMFRAGCQSGFAAGRRSAKTEEI